MDVDKARLLEKNASFLSPHEKHHEGELYRDRETVYLQAAAARKTGYGVKIAYYSRDFYLEAAAAAVRKRERAFAFPRSRCTSR